MERGGLRVVAKATPVELNACQRLMRGLASLFQIVRIGTFEPYVAQVVLDEVAKTAQRAARIECADGVPGVQRARVLTGVKARRFAPPPLRGADGLDAGSAHARPDWLLLTMPTHTPPTCCGRRPVQGPSLSSDR